MSFFNIRVRIRRRIRVRLRSRSSRDPGRKLYLAHKEAARTLVRERIAHFMGYYGPRHSIAVGKIAIRNQRSRWGSCSRKGNLNFNYKLTFLPPEVRDYVIVHEICHIKEFNHGPGFWALVAEIVPEHKRLRAMLRDPASLLQPQSSQEYR